MEGTAMTAAREGFLQRVRQALKESNRPGQVAPLPERGSVGYQGGGDDLAARFCVEFANAGGNAHLVADYPTARTRVLELFGSCLARRVLLGAGRVVAALELSPPLGEQGCEVFSIEQLAPASCREALFGADLGISGVDCLVAETGTVVFESRRTEPRSLSLLPPVHIAVAERGQLIPDLFDLFESKLAGDQGRLPACVSLITGPSKTGDIEMRLVTGVHGPAAVHVVLIGE
jgi:L-lactate dehydrogenase complex protein LldG